MASLSYVKAQKDNADDSLVQFSGLVMSSDSLMALSDVNIRIKGNFYGTISNSLGIFTLVAKKKRYSNVYQYWLQTKAIHCTCQP
ncbi:hypothetical protein QQ054_23840 [Oscillatoria amoena NRMC-F 0135]|nr:hypothetical protein [Oscillatoria amoena NRMC-F 0135]